MDRRTRSLRLGIAFALLASVLWTTSWSFGLVATRVALKPFPVLLMAGMLAEAPAGRWRGLLRVALLWCALGDLLLELPTDALVASLAPYGVGVLLLAVGLLGVERRPLPVRLLPPLLLGLGMAGLLWGPMGSQRGPLLAYAALVVVMAWRALCTLERPGGRLLCGGATLFVASDALLGVDRFLGPLPGGHAAVVWLYWAALALFVGACFRGVDGGNAG